MTQMTKSVNIAAQERAAACMSSERVDFAREEEGLGVEEQGVMGCRAERPRNPGAAIGDDHGIDFDQKKMAED